jgi:phosphoglycerate kinase
MTITTDQMLSWCQSLYESLEKEAKLATDLAAIPKLDSLADLPAGTQVLIRGDVDAKPGAEVGKGDIRLRSMLETLKFGRERGWKQVIFGHIGRDPAGSLDKVAARLGELLGIEVPLIDDWYDPASNTVTDAAADAVASAAEGSVLVLQNTRKYDIERVLWKAQKEDLPQHAGQLASYAASLREKIAKVYVFEALSAGNADSSSAVAPAAMDRVVLGKYVEAELSGPMAACLKAEACVFSGIKIDKLSKLESMLAEGRIKRVFSAGSLAMALKKASALLDGKEFCIGATENPANAKEAFYIPPERIEQAKQVVANGRRNGIEFILPVDFVMADESIKETLEADDQQFDIGPQSIALFDEKVGEFIAEAKERDDKPVLFHNGVFGMFEDPRFEQGTRSFVQQLKRMSEAGIHVFVGGGEGGKSLEKYGEESWVEHNFTAGGTVLSAIGAEPIPYMAALKLASRS